MATTGLRASLSAISKIRPSRVVVAFAAMALHLLLLLAFRVSAPARKAPLERITWITLPELQPSSTPPVRMPGRPLRGRAPAIQIPPAPPATSVRDPAVDALHDYVACAVTPEQQQRGLCAKLRAGLHPAPLAKRTMPTPAEEARDKRLAREEAFDKAPKKVPCFPVSSLGCLLDGFENGFKIESYAEAHPESKRGDGLFPSPHGIAPLQ